MQRFAPFLETSELPSLGSKPRASRLPAPQLNEQLDDVFASAALNPQSRELIRSVLLLWHDHLDASHVICQSIENSDGSLVHAMMHRREGDFWNSKYWFNRAGYHPAFAHLVEQIKSLQSSGLQGIAGQIVSGGKWNAAAFVDLCERYTGKEGSAEYRSLQQVQRLETIAVLNTFSNETNRR